MCYRSKRKEKDALDLIHRLQAESERLNSKYKNLEINYNAVWEDFRKYEVENAEQKAEIERLTEENGYLDGCAKQFLADYQKCEIERAELQKQVTELTKENERLKKFEMYRIKAMKEDKEEIERLTAGLISMDREQEGYIATIKDLNKQIDEFVKIARVTDTKKLVEGIKKQAVEDTAKEIISFVEEKDKKAGKYSIYRTLLQELKERYEVE
jgi:chromosome segregation ATPase